MYRVAPLPLLVIAAVSTIPVAILTTASELSYGPAGTSGEQALRALVQLIPVLLLSPISVAATTILTVDVLHGAPTSAGRCLEVVGDRFWTMAAVVVVTAVGFVAGLAALVIPGIVVLILWLFAAQVCVVEGRGVRASFSRSTALVRGAFWWTLLAFIVISVTVGLAAAVAASALALAAAPLSGDAEIVVVGLTTLVASTVIQPVGNLGLSLMFLERRMARDGSWPLPRARGGPGEDG
jgi:hypothetical protein